MDERQRLDAAAAAAARRHVLQAHHEPLVQPPAAELFEARAGLEAEERVCADRDGVRRGSSRPLRACAARGHPCPPESSSCQTQSRAALNVFSLTTSCGSTSGSKLSCAARQHGSHACDDANLTVEVVGLRRRKRSLTPRAQPHPRAGKRQATCLHLTVPRAPAVQRRLDRRGS
jgi:hypothetical protein